jgi:hypothetical protein
MDKNENNFEDLKAIIRDVQTLEHWSAAARKILLTGLAMLAAGMSAFPLGPPGAFNQLMGALGSASVGVAWFYLAYARVLSNRVYRKTSRPSLVVSPVFAYAAASVQTLLTILLIYAMWYKN